MGSDSDSKSSSSSDSDKKEKKTKTPKTKKPKLVYCTSQSFQKRYNSLYNNKTHSNITLKIEASGETFHAHKLILSACSEFFENLTEDNYTFPKEEEEAAVKSLLKYYYEGSLEYSQESAVVSFMLLATKYKTKNLSEFKIPAKVLLNGIIGYIEKDLNNRVGEFDKLAESVDFKKMEKEDLTKMYAKKKWLQKSSTFLNQIILKDMSDDESGSEKDSEEEEEEEEEEEGSSSSSAVWDPKNSHASYYTYDKKKKNSNIFIYRKLLVWNFSWKKKYKICY